MVMSKMSNIYDYIDGAKSKCASEIVHSDEEEETETGKLNKFKST